MNTYPDNWKQIAFYVKTTWGWICERCGHRHEPPTGYCLTVHHLVPDKSLCELWNLACLCQRCHLSIQARVNMFQEMLPGMVVSEWFIPHLVGFREWQERTAA